MDNELLLLERNERMYMTARAEIVEGPSELPTEVASSIRDDTLNPSFLWVAGRYVQANQTNLNGQTWTLDDLRYGERSIRYTPINVLHDSSRAVGVYAESKIVYREGADDIALLPEIQALGVIWEANFPEVANMIRVAHAQNTLWYSMECVPEKKQCLSCEKVFEYAVQETCEHLSDPRAPRRLINPTFLGGALIFPPVKPGWPDADITEVAENLTLEFAEERANPSEDKTSPELWQELIDIVAALD